MARLDPMTKRLVALYADGQRELDLMVREALTSGALGTAAYRQRQMLAVNALLNALQRTAIPEAGKLVIEGYASGLEIAEGDRDELQGQFNGIHTAALQVLLDAISNSLNDAVRTVGRQVDDVFRREGLRISALQMIEAGTRGDASNALQEALLKKGHGAFRDRAGRTWSLENYSSMVLATTPREAQTVATVNRLAIQGDDLITISKHKHPHDECSKYEGKTYSLTGRDKRYPKAERLPPFHPRCRHVVLPAAATYRRSRRVIQRAGSLEEMAEALGVAA